MSHNQEHLADPHVNRKGYITGNDHALPYLSRFSKENTGKEVPKVLSHLSCSYFSTPGQPPTLLALKQHAQSLAYAIMLLNPSVKAAGAGEILSSNTEQGRRLGRGEAFDWLGSMAEPYSNDDPDHHKVLTSLLNEVKSHHDVLGTEYHCPMAESGVPRQRGQPSMPYASHHNLAMHANACLERLDHELGATGGILSLLPTEAAEDSEELAAARNSILGQLLLWAQALVARTHEMEMENANLLDALAGEAVAPLQHLSSLGPDARSVGRQIAYPQDRWVLANAGDDVLGYLHDLLDRQEALIEEKEKVWRELGVLGERMWIEDRGRAYARGIVHVNIETRYYRIKGQGRNTIFVVPAWEHHPGVAHTRDVLEKNPTVVAVPAPRRFGGRDGDGMPQELLQRQHDGDGGGRYAEAEAAAAAAAELNAKHEERVRSLAGDVRALKKEGRRQRQMVEVLRAALGRGKQELADQLAALGAMYDDLRAEHERLTPHAEGIRGRLDGQMRTADELRKQLKEEQSKVRALEEESDGYLAEVARLRQLVGTRQ